MKPLELLASLYLTILPHLSFSFTTLLDATVLAALLTRRHGQDELPKFKPSIKIGKKGDIDDFERSFK